MDCCPGVGPWGGGFWQNVSDKMEPNIPRCLRIICEVSMHITKTFSRTKGWIIKGKSGIHLVLSRLLNRDRFPAFSANLGKNMTIFANHVSRPYSRMPFLETITTRVEMILWMGQEKFVFLKNNFLEWWEENGNFVNEEKKIWNFSWFLRKMHVLQIVRNRHYCPARDKGKKTKNKYR